MQSDFTQVAAAGILALMILDKVFAFLKKNEPDDNYQKLIRDLGEVLQSHANSDARVHNSLTSIDERTKRWEKALMAGDLRCKFSERDAVRIVDSLTDDH